MRWHSIKHGLKSEFIKNVATLFSGTALAQLIPLIITPILTRIYTPTDYGVLAVFVAITSLAAVASTLRYDVAILMPENDKDAMAIIFLSGLSVLFMSAFMMAITVFYHEYFVALISIPSIDAWLYAMPVSVALVGWGSTLNYWLNRKKKYRKIAINRVVTAFVLSGASVLLGVCGLKYEGLIIGTVLSQLISFIVLSFWVYRDVLSGVSELRFDRLKRVASTYQKFPLFSLPSDFINHFSQQLPALMLNTFFSATVVGFFSFSQKVLGAPLRLMAQSVSDVFRQRASVDYNKNGNCSAIFYLTSKALAALSIIPSLVMIAFSPDIFRFFFGTEWVEAGQYTRYLVPLYMFRFIVSPLSYVFFIANRQDADLIGQVCLLLVTFGSMLVGAYLDSPDMAICLFSLGYVLIYGFYFWAALKLAQGNTFIFKKGNVRK